MAIQKNTISCPKCNTEIDIDRALYSKVELELEQRFNQKTKEADQKLADSLSELESKKQQLASKEKEVEDKIAQGVKSELAAKEKSLKEQIKKELDQENADIVSELQKELNQNSDQLKELRKKEAEFARFKREADQLKDKLEAESETKLNEAIKVEREKISKEQESKAEINLKEKDLLIEQLKSDVKEMQRRAEQGSMQAQGEAMELAIEEFLQANYPLDTIEEIKKGARGADCIQIVNSYSRPNCGKIYYESKNTKAWSNDWITKFKADMQEKVVDVGVLVTKAYPTGTTSMTQIDGVWVCSFEEFKVLSAALRDSLIKVSMAISTQQGKADKMTLLYDFLTGNEFRMQVEAIVEGFTSLKSDLDKEKRAMARLWKQREKQIDKVIANTTLMYGSVKGIAGESIQSVSALELGDGDELDDLDELLDLDLGID
jgi:hypothetical protein